MNDRIRLHISPLNPELLRVILPPSVFPSATDISYHALQTFPERNYGYVELPAMEAKKIKKKLNGSILKGSKMRVEEARPSRKRKAGTDEDLDKEIEKGQKSKKSKKQKLENGMVPGHELSEGRKVRRGWTEPAKVSKDKRSKKEKSSKEASTKVKTEASTYTDKSECLFKTKLPKSSETASSKQPGEKSQKKKSKGTENEVVIHEFERTAKYPSFLRDTQASQTRELTREFVEGRGWVDKDGNVVEEAKPSKRAKSGSERSTQPSLPAREQNNKHKAQLDPDGKPNGKAAPPKTPKSPIIATALEDDETSSSGSSSLSSDPDSGDDADNDEKEAALAPSKPNIPTLKVTPEPADEPSKPDQPAEAPSTSIHPLEQLYKRSPPRGSPKPSLKPTSTPRSTSRNPNLKVHTTFSFFDEENDENAEDIPKTSKEPADPNDDSLITNGSSGKRPPRVHKNIMIPQTPFTQLDFHERGIRSAAPTPDTAAPNKLYFEGLWKRGAGDDDSSEEDVVNNDHAESSGLGVDLEAVQEEEDEDEEPATATKEGARNGKAKQVGGEGKPESEFSKWFWEHRGETNRAWKQRRREAKKEKKRADRKRAGGRSV